MLNAENDVFPRVENVHKESCKLIHFASRHIFAGASRRFNSGVIGEI
jgi:hypothetical protein